MKITSFSLLALGALSIAACKQAEEKSAAGTPAAKTEEKSSAPAAGETAPADAPAASGEATTTASGLKYWVLKRGAGSVSPKATDEVTVHYEGTLLNGTVFDSSLKRGKPISFPLNGVIPGWTEGLQLMKEGDKFKFEIPANLAYGAQSPSPAIPPNSTLVFEVELIKVN
ncbi:FKBP-type peptidyl-prolyl cis-trans isomerase [Luteolibacter luteus]|jgi:FKBP-type peptidyl-prolyl cis-trans isomerase|uniref:Peptidyl-prolyl cis-trans isomerase n=1 Tax=Luteolibacter luteus TaxID=2728835 RepID=A0A858RGS4_9BACT|nr:FKBP-type peptidyl-prolyl cis-trans isomerase [Luteolibacter luteus]QJE95323.1 FKBP-type peptidyl-prolyl cis-trans isomerase [Luteolibacter luteus]